MLAVAGSVAASAALGSAAFRLGSRADYRAAAEPPVRTPSEPPKSYQFAKTFDAERFLRGNIHTHTTLSDGTSTPERTILWYVTHGYQFLALTDHNLLSDPERYVTLHDPEFVLLPGEEVTMMGGGRQVHVNALCTRTRISGGAFPTQSIALETAIERVLVQGGVAVVNHPNFDWALTLSNLVDARDAPLLEIASGHPYVHTAGNSTHPSHEALWDAALTTGADYMGVAVDDVHRIDASGNPLALPGRAWVETFGTVPDAADICGALSRGALYASTGVELRRIMVTRTTYVVEPVRRDAVVTFIGANGQVLSRRTIESPSTAATYVITGSEGYVRARVDTGDGARAWTPAVRLVVD